MTDSDEAAVSARGGLKAWDIVAVLIAGLAVALRMKTVVYAHSTDLALHYQLADSISRSWVWPTLTKPLATAMSAYPPLAHYLGAMAGLPFHSALVGVQLVAAMSVFGCYLILIRCLTSGGRLGDLVALAAAAVGVLAARTQSAAEGFEIFYSFFYAQIVGQVVFLGFVVWLSTTPRRWPVRLSASAVAVFVCGWLYLLTSVEIALSYMSLEAFLLARQWLRTRNLEVRRLTPLAAGAVFLPLLVLIHPEFRWMMTISGNNGALTLGALDGMVPALSIVLLLLGAALGVLAPETSRWRAGLLPLAAAACGCATAALLQQAAWSGLHMGSEYAVKKYSYGVVTLLIFCTAAGIGAVIDGRKDRRAWPPTVALAPPILAALATIFLPTAAPDRLDKFSAYQAYMRHVLASGRAPKVAKGLIVSNHSGFGWSLNFAATLVDLDMDPKQAYAAVLGPPQASPALYAFADKPDEDFPDSCIVPGSTAGAASLTLIHCQAFSTIGPAQSVGVGQSKRLPRFFLSGWSGREGDSVWNDGKSAEIGLHFSDTPENVLFAFDGGAFLPASVQSQRVDLLVGHVPVGHWTFDQKAPSGVQQVLIPGSLVRNGDVKLTFAFPDAISPSALKLSNDPRTLAFSMKGFSVDTGLAPGDRIDLAKLAVRPAALASGWSGKEALGVWSDGPSAKLVLFVKSAPDVLKVSLLGGPFAPHAGYVQHVAIRAQGVLVSQWALDLKTGDGEHTISVPRKLMNGPFLTLDLSFPDATSPLENKVSTDPRRLGFFLRSIVLDH